MLDIDLLLQTLSCQQRLALSTQLHVLGLEHQPDSRLLKSWNMDHSILINY
jgi:hypothetical protein